MCLYSVVLDLHKEGGGSVTNSDVPASSSGRNAVSASPCMFINFFGFQLHSV